MGKPVRGAAIWGGILLGFGLSMIALGWWHHSSRTARTVQASPPSAVVTTQPEVPPDDLAAEVKRLRKTLEDERDVRKTMQREIAVLKERCRNLNDDVDVLRDLRRDLEKRIEAMEKKAK